MLLACPFDDRAVGVELNDHQPFGEIEKQVDHPGSDAAGAANHNVSAAMNGAQTLHGNPVHPGQKRSAEGDEKTGQGDAGQHEQHRGDDIDRVAAVGCHVAVAGRRHCRNHEIDGVEPSPSKNRVEVPGANQKHSQGGDSEPNEDRVEPRRMIPPAAQQRPQSTSDFRSRQRHRLGTRAALERGNLTVDDEFGFSREH